MRIAIAQRAGASLSLWAPDEEFFYINANLRERTYGGFFATSRIGIKANSSPDLILVDAGLLWGAPTYGFAQYNSAVGAGLVFSSSVVGENPPTNSTTPNTFLWGLGKYGFMMYDNSSFAMASSVVTGDTVTTFLITDVWVLGSGALGSETNLS